VDGVGNDWIRSGQAAPVVIGRPVSLVDVSGAAVKRAYRHRLYPTDGQAVELSRTFGCVRLVYGFRWRDGHLTLAKMDQPLAIVWSRPLPEGAEPSTVTVSRDPAGRWHVSILVETTVERLAPTVAVVGVDAGLTSLLTLSTGEKISNPKHEHRERAVLARAQRNLARKAKDSNNRDKARTRVARVYARIADRRRDLLHKLTTRLVRENCEDGGVLFRAVA